MARQIPDPAVTVPSQQFFDLGSFDPGFDDYNQMMRMVNRNPRFAWPKNYFRQIDGRVVELQRGYIRLLLPSNGSNATSQGTPRCFFQFNPDSITRGITARNDVQLWVNQDPGQLGQPLYGDQNFSFELLFNREAEVAAGIEELHSLGGQDTVEPAFVDGAVVNGGSSSAETVVYRPQEVGVLADLAVLDAVIGVGISESTIDQQVKAYNARQQYLTSRTTVDSAGDGSTTTTSYPQIKNPQDFLNANIGNKAFLMPNPVRIIFSRLFMLDGYIQSIQVTFNKFSPSMVPTQCSVAIQMQALYFGFAKKDTFLTKYLDTPIDTTTDGRGNIPTASSPPAIQELTQISNKLMNYAEHVSSNRKEQIADFGVSAPKSDNKITFTFELSLAVQDWLKKNKPMTIDFEPWLLYTISDGNTVLFSGSAAGTNVKFTENSSNGYSTITCDFYPTRPSTFDDNVTTIFNVQSTDFKFEADIHIDMKSGGLHIQGNQNASFVAEGLGFSEEFSFGKKAVPRFGA